MKKRILLFAFVHALFLFSACEKEFYEKEVYRKIVYIVNSDNMIDFFTHPFTGASTEGFMSLYCSGSLFPDNDINIEIGFDDELIGKYNYIEFENNEAKYVKALPSNYFEIPSFSVTIKKGEASVTMPIFVTSEGLSPDTTYVIPLKIISASGFEVNPDLSSILYAIKLENAYSGLYRMTGSLLKQGDTGMPQQVFKDKTVVPINRNTCRMFISTESELEENIGSRTVIFSLRSDNSVVIKEENNLIDLGGSLYDPERKVFTLNYGFISNGTRYEIQEKLVRIEE